MKTRFTPLLIAAAAAASFAFTLPAQAQASSDDASIASSVKTALSSSSRFSDNPSDVIVKVQNGRVNLSGWVTYQSDIQDAEDVALKVPGVRGVTANFRTWSSEDRP